MNYILKGKYRTPGSRGKIHFPLFSKELEIPKNLK
jgi:hypothetical protein